ncbi:MAG: amidase [Vicinamibacterales bacterium]
MTVDRWLAWALSDARNRNIDGLVPLLESLGHSMQAVRSAEWDCDPSPGTAASAATVPVLAGDAQTASSVRTPTPEDPVGPEFWPLTELAARLRDGSVRAQDVLDRCLARIAAANPTLNAMICVETDRARMAAEAADRRRAAGGRLGPLHGVPITLKDLIDWSGVPTTAASRVRQGHVAAGDAPIVERLVGAGAIVVGKTNLHEFAMGPTSEDSAFGPPIHPVDPSRSPGGSSGGSAVAVVAGMCSASIGTDTGGSIRIPASACGLVGLKPTFGEIPLDGVVPLAWSMDHAGPLTRTVDDAWQLFDVLTRAAPAGPVSRTQIERLRFAVLEPYFCDLLDPGVRHAFESAIAKLRDAGAQIERLGLPSARYVAPVYFQTVLAEAFAYHSTSLDTQPDAYTPPVRLRLEAARYVPASDYVRAQRGRLVIASELDRLLERADALLLPTLPVAASRRGASTVSLDGREEPVRSALLRLTQVFNLTGHPAITIPIGEAEPGLRAGLQLASRKHETRLLLAAARSCEDVLSR